MFGEDAALQVARIPRSQEVPLPKRTLGPSKFGANRCASRLRCVSPSDFMFLHCTDNVIIMGGAVREPAVAVIVTVLVPTGVPGLLCVLLPPPPPQAGIHKAASDNTATKLNSRMAPRDFFPVDSTSPRNPGSIKA